MKPNCNSNIKTQAILLLCRLIAFHLQLVLLSYHPIFLRPYHFLKLVFFLGANRTKSASVCLWLFRGAIYILEYNTIQNVSGSGRMRLYRTCHIIRTNRGSGAKVDKAEINGHCFVGLFLRRSSWRSYPFFSCSSSSVTSSFSSPSCSQRTGSPG